MNKELDELFELAVSSWERQGRPAEQKHALRNFLTGKGVLLKNDILTLIERERKEAVAKALKNHQNCITPKSWEDSDPTKPGVILT
jgi:hypothetical protein